VSLLVTIKAISNREVKSLIISRIIINTLIIPKQIYSGMMRIISQSKLKWITSSVKIHPKLTIIPKINNKKLTRNLQDREVTTRKTNTFLRTIWHSYKRSLRILISILSSRASWISRKRRTSLVSLNLRWLKKMMMVQLNTSLNLPVLLMIV